MSAGGRRFGLTPRQGRGHARQQATGDRWISVHVTAPDVRAAISLDGPIPNKREKVKRTFTTYCALHLGHPRNAAPKKVELLRHLYSLIKMADDTAVIRSHTCPVIK